MFLTSSQDGVDWLHLCIPNGFRGPGSDMTSRPKIRFTVEGYELKQRDVRQPKNRAPTTSVPRGWTRIVIIDVSDQPDLPETPPARRSKENPNR